ncbi:protease modulator HflC [Aerosticca soli]|jgi:membrane protease subunit HflC|uniref:Protein HflC n=1 Tax=Aerosticca soli TaxID=2010829 RepID=A0A2Z6E7D7_9GAMM|nr:protease modulator HflC [Aerosticca soli]BBD80631.1 HflC protein [Aerosticca soli]
MKLGAAILLALLVLLGLDSVYLVNEGQSALVVEFGRLVRSEKTPGIHLKLPLVERVVRLDERILQLDAAPERYLAAGNRNVSVDFYAKWRIADAATYYRATRADRVLAAQRLTPVLKNALRAEIANHALDELVVEGADGMLDEVRRRVDAGVRESLGVTLVDVRIKRLELPAEVREAVYQHMRAERLAEAGSLRAAGQEAAAKLRAEADRDAQSVRAEADRDAARLRGEGDAEAATIYAQAYGQDAEFFAFYRSLVSYRRAFRDGNGTVVLKPGEGFLRYFDDTDHAKP